MRNGKAWALLGSGLILLASFLIPGGYSIVEEDNVWYGYWHQWQNHTDNPENISTSDTIYAPTGVYFNVALVVSVYSYTYLTSMEDIVDFKVALYFDSFGSGSFLPVPARVVTLKIEKDTEGSNLNDQRMEFYYSDTAPPGYHQGKYLWQTNSLDSDSLDRQTWSLDALAFAVGLFNEDIGMALGLIDLATSWSKGGDYYDAGNADPFAVSYWSAESVYFGSEDPLQQYAFNTVNWWQYKDTNPSTYYGIKVWAEIDFDQVGNPFPFDHIDTAPVYLRIYHDPPPPPPPGGGACPYVSVWNGASYLLDNNVLPRAELSNGIDVEDYYRLEQTPVTKEGKYSFLLSEFEREHSYFDQVKLLAVDHNRDVDIAITPDGEILTYKSPTLPASAIDNNGIDRLNEISLMDGNVSDPSTYFLGENSDYLTLNFRQVNSDRAKLILRDDWKCCDLCIDVQVLDSNSEWQTVTTLTPRTYWAMEGVDLSAYVIKNLDFMVRLLWTSPHRLDYVGLDTTTRDNYDLRVGTLFSATHSVQGDVKTLLTQNDNVYAELLPGEQIQLEFTLPHNSKPERTYILCAEGYYQTIIP